ncbi:MAG TPA: hypothetical protein VGF84_16740, partial [Micromonosporaceae bacterium]
MLEIGFDRNPDQHRCWFGLRVASYSSARRQFTESDPNAEQAEPRPSLPYSAARSAGDLRDVGRIGGGCPSPAHLVGYRNRYCRGRLSGLRVAERRLSPPLPPKVDPVAQRGAEQHYRRQEG